MNNVKDNQHTWHSDCLFILYIVFATLVVQEEVKVEELKGHVSKCYLLSTLVVVSCPWSVHVTLAGVKKSKV